MASRERDSLDRTIGPDRVLVAMQFVLESGVALGALLEFLLIGSGFTLINGWVSLLVGVALLIAGLFVASAAKRDLAANFSTSPTPVAGGQLVDSGIYARLRHPMYFGILLLSLGWAIVWGSWFGLAGTAVAAAFFVFKSRREERLLAHRYPEYAAYRDRVRGGIVPRP